MTMPQLDDHQLEGVRGWLIGLVHEHRLSPTQRRVVQHMLDSMPQVAFASTIDMAEAAGVSQPTVTRIATALGFSGYAEFRNAARDAVLSATPPPAASTTGPPPTTPGAALAHERQNLRTVEATIASDAMRRAVDLIADSRPLGIVGLRVSAALANYVGYLAQRIMPDVHVLDDAAGLDDDLTQLHLDGATTLLVFAMPRYPDATVRALARARELGMTTVGIVDTPLAPFAHLIDVCLVAPVGQDLVFDSHAAAVTLSIALLEGVAASDARRTRTRLEAHEERVAEWEYRAP
ncbi:DNA-binding MurR/RpiR family transcriptional regulator [Frigoribacterium faeni]|uniref:DNA-binding MurR/RpiR family transcriptional regulator n=2 Tax=Frigoribacterium faeni TaxID=145483 RepID=A0A7W3PIX0_9MICO|nr:DNA-binding MurR/RpiR family transcriptional regulator [Frigoribacterium faeni]